MQELVREYLNELKKKQKKRRRIRIIVMAFALVVAGSVIWSLTQAGIAMTGSAKCGMEEHTHGDGCYTDTLACGQEESAGHTHTDACWQTTQTLVCGQEESEEHVHAEACYQTEQTLVCGQEEYAGHAHTEACYSRQLACGRQEHIHTDACFTDNSADVEDASKWAAQYEKTEWKDVWGEDLVIAARQQLDYKESVANYVVAEDGSHKGYTRYGQFAGDNYTDWDASFVNFCMYYAGLTESKLFPDEKKTADWYDKFVKAEEGKNKVYLTTPAGYEPEEGDIIFTNRENEETDLQMGIISSYDKEKNEIKVIEGNSGNQVKENTYAIDDKYITEYLKISEMEQEYKKQENETAVGTTEEVNAETEETAAPEENPAGSVEKVYTDGTIIVRASYDEDAEIPAEAELIAEQITAEDHEEHYAERESEFRETLKNEKATMRALLKIGFYVDGKEVEPKSPVTITVQFLDENGLAEGKPVTVVHFADQGAEVLDGSKADNNSTTFRTESFSEFAIGEEAEAIAEGKSFPVNKSFEYEDEMFHITFRVVGNAIAKEKKELESEEKAVKETIAKDLAEEGESKYQFKVRVLDEESDTYKEFSDYAEEADNGGERLLLQAMSYSLFYEETELELSDGEVTAEITPTTALNKTAQEAIDEMENVDLDEEIEEEDDSVIAPFNETKEQHSDVLGVEDVYQNLQNDNEMPGQDNLPDKGVVVSVLGMQVEEKASGGIDEVGSAVLEEGMLDSKLPTITANLTGPKFAARATKLPNPKFEVQYYANLDMVVTTTTAPSDLNTCLPVIDTTGKNLPANSSSQTLRYLRPTDTATGGKVLTQNTLTEVYRARPDLTYYKAPNITYMDALIKNESYDLAEIWVLKDGRESSSTNENDWDKYTYSEDLHFTNRPESATAKPGDDSGYILIRNVDEKKAIIRFVYETKKSDANNPKSYPEFDANFYDYDISDGYTTNNGTKIMDTKAAGINSASNYDGDGAKFAFGNMNCGTSYGGVKWQENLINAGNSGVYKGCTFGLAAKKLAKNLKDIEYADGIVGPSLFGTTAEGVKGKTIYDDGKLVFDRNGDTYTLTAANSTKAKVDLGNLDVFTHPKPEYKHLWTNSFWPLDNITNKDFKFGSNSLTQKFGTGDWDRLPAADNGQDHNCFFGMYYEVDFTLSEDYLGPLEYYFFGDDDMWVYLDEDLVCDIGGTHLVAGEYVDLWDYFKDANGNKKGDGQTHKLRFFYTERGASGSTCWMQFTLPSITSIDTASEDDYGKLKVQKKVSKYDENGEREEITAADNFKFSITLTNKGIHLADDYAYVKYAKDGTVLERDLVVWDGAKFELNNGEYIIIEFLPDGTDYEIIEESGAVTVGTVDNGKYSYSCKTDIAIGESVIGKENEGAVRLEQIKTDLESDRIVNGDIEKGKTKVVEFHNKFTVYRLPGTGGPGIYLYMFGGVLILSAASLMTYRKKCRGVLRS